jgi:hypothetical protein
VNAVVCPRLERGGAEDPGAPRYSRPVAAGQEHQRYDDSDETGSHHAII